MIIDKIEKPRCIINYSSGRYVRSAVRQKQKLDEVGYKDGYLTWLNHYPPGCYPHDVIPYHFKPMAFFDAYRQGYRNILWMDAPVYPARSLDPIFETIERDGYLIIRNGWSNGEWTADSALAPLKMSREHSFHEPHAMACVMGFDLSREDVMIVFNNWLQSALEAFPGPWINDKGQASSDSRVLGHRHDQSAISAFAHQAGWHFTPPDDGKLITYGNQEGYLLYSQPVI